MKFEISLETGIYSIETACTEEEFFYFPIGGKDTVRHWVYMKALCLQSENLDFGTNIRYGRVPRPSSY